MSFKGIAWAGNVYEKFEAMCLEMEEAMYQDTVKYMENQVQKVGVSVKKFYSEVMDDLRPLSCVDPTSLASDDLSPIPHGLADVHKKHKPITLLKKQNEDQVISNEKAEKGSSTGVCDANLFSPQSPGIFIENKSSDKCAASKKIGIQRRPIGIKRISRNNHPSKESSRNTFVSEDRISKVASERTKSRLTSDDTGVTSSFEINEKCELRESAKGNASVLDNLLNSPASDKTPPPESVRQDDKNGTSSLVETGVAVKGNTPSCDNLRDSLASKEVSSAESTSQTKDVVDCISMASDNNLLDKSERLQEDPESATSCIDLSTELTGAPVNCTPFSVLDSSDRSKVCNFEYEEKGVTLPVEGASIKDGSSSASSTPGNTLFCNKDLITCRDSFEMEMLGNEEIKFEESGKVKLEESCILVEAEDPQYALQGTRKHKSYKKRFREVFSSKSKSRKEQDKKEEVSEPEPEPGKQKLSPQDSVESEWELL